MDDPQIAPSKSVGKSAIAALVDRLIQAGCDPSEAAAAVAEAHALGAMSRGQIEAENRRAYDRNRKRRWRSLSQGQSRDNSKTQINSDTSLRDTVPGHENPSLSYIEDLVIKKERKNKKERASPLSRDWKPTQRHVQLCRELGVPLQAIEEIFRDDCAAKGKLYVDHDAAFCTYIRNHNKFNGKPVRSNRKDRRAEEFDEIRAELKRSIDQDRARQDGNQSIAGLLSFDPGK